MKWEHEYEGSLVHQFDHPSLITFHAIQEGLGIP